MQLRVEINKMKNKQTNINETKNWFVEKNQ